jgi:hydroxyjasmonate sulfotransferase
VSEFFKEKPDDISVEFDLFCEGVSGYGPFWDHCLEYWRERVTNTDRVLFLRYEAMMLEPVKFVKRLAAFLGAPCWIDLHQDGPNGHLGPLITS